MSLDIAVPSDRLCFPKYSALGWGDLLDWNIAETRTDLALKSVPTIRGDFKPSTVVYLESFIRSKCVTN